MTTPRRAFALDTLVAQVDAAYPDRDKTIGPDGWLGDAAHQARQSDHNPNDAGVVTAQDISHDPAHGFDSYAFGELLRQRRDPRIKYVISNRRIFFGPRSPSHANDPSGQWQWEHYGLEDPHDKHIHISVGADAKYYDDAAPWDLTAVGPVEPAPPPQPIVLRGKGSWYSQYDGRFHWHDPSDAPGSNALRVPDSRQGIALMSRATLGHWFDVTAPNHKTLLLPQSEIGPNPRTGRTIDISARAAEAFGYTPLNFPTDSIFVWSPAAPPVGLEHLDPRAQAIAYEPIQTVTAAAPPTAPATPTATIAITTTDNVRILLNGKDITGRPTTMSPILTNLSTNWKTSAAGGLLILYALASLAGVTIPGVPVMDGKTAIAAIISGIMGLLAKDANVTGGTVQQ